MTTIEWFENAESNLVKLKQFIGDFHPLQRNPHALVGLPITAGMAEHACAVVRENIRKNSEGNPVEQFDEAIKNKNLSKAMKLLNEAWFGVPESTSCWNIKGFREAVDLMDDPPE